MSMNKAENRNCKLTLINRYIFLLQIIEDQEKELIMSPVIVLSGIGLL